MIFDYSLLSDDELVMMMKHETEEDDTFKELTERYKKFINFKARSYFIAGADKEDIYQEGLIGLYNAVRSYDPSKPASFNTFAILCITRQIQSAVKMASRKKHQPLNGYISLWGEDKQTNEIKEKYGLTQTDPSEGPEEALVKREFSDRVRYVIDNLLSEKEKDLYTDFIQGYSYKEISARHQENMKAIDNAIQRARKKIGIYTKSY